MKPKLIRRQIESDRGGPLSAYVKHYITQVQGQGYVPRSVDNQLRLLKLFGRWLGRTHREVHDLTEAVVDDFLYRKLKGRWPHVAAPATLRRLLAMLRQRGATPAAEVQRRTPAQQLLCAYERFLVEERNLSNQSIPPLSLFASRFLADQFGNGPLKLSHLRAPDVTAFVQRHIPRHGSSHAKKLVSAVRSFLRYLHYKGKVATDLSLAVPKVACGALSTLPKHLSAAQVQRVLSHCDRSTPMGRRDYAILLLLARLGLRAGEVVGLNLADIDWENARITVCGKGDRWAQLPLPAEVARAIANYLRRDRARCGCRRLFLGHRAPVGGFQHAAGIARIVAKALDKAGVKSARKGAHLLRHSLATAMLRKGASLDEIGEVLRHKSPDSTALYAKIDLDALQTLVVPWIGGVR
jgi:site-specific recombinase XerD